MRNFLLLFLLSLCTIASGNKPVQVPPVVHSRIGQTVSSPDSAIALRLTGQLHGYGKGPHYDADIASPKSVSFSPDGSRFYINSLEGGKTVVYDARTLRKIKVISHRFSSGEGPHWLPASEFYKFTHYKDGAKRPFMGKPVESCLTPDGRYLFVPYYRRSFDINAQDPSALAVIDTRNLEIVLMMETGPLPKMVQVSHDGKLLAITHWGNNTVGLVDISSPDPKKWRHHKPITVHHVHPLNYPLDREVNRDSGSGYSLRGTLFLPGDSLLLVSAMGGSAAVIDVKRDKWLGWLPSFFSVRHFAADRNFLYASRNSAGEVLKVPLDSLTQAIKRGASGMNFKVNGIDKVKVGGGTRTIELSPSGRFLFAACNTVSALYIIDTHSMKVIATTPVDSYPVGLDVAPDGSMVIVTSQGRKGFGGNAVNLFEASYSSPEVTALTAPATLATGDSLTAHSESNDSYYATDTDNTFDASPWIIAIISVGVLLCALIIAIILLRRRR